MILPNKDISLTGGVVIILHCAYFERKHWDYELNGMVAFWICSPILDISLPTVVVGLDYVDESLERRKLIPSRYFQLSERYQKSSSSHVASMAKA